MLAVHVALDQLDGPLIMVRSARQEPHHLLLRRKPFDLLHLVFGEDGGRSGQRLARQTDDADELLPRSQGDFRMDGKDQDEGQYNGGQRFRPCRPPPVGENQADLLPAITVM